MPSRIDLARELAACHPKPFKGVPGAFHFVGSSPANSFYSVVAPFASGDRFLEIVARNWFDPGLAAAALQEVREKRIPPPDFGTMTLVDGFSYGDFPFDTLAVLSPSYGNSFRHVNDRLAVRVFRLSPICRFELTGEESPSEFDLVTSESLDSLDWRRKPGPRVLVATGNKKARPQSARAKLLTGKVRDIPPFISQIRRADGSWLRIGNWRNEIMEIDWTGEEFRIVTLELSRETTSEASVRKITREFLMRPADHPVRLPEKSKAFRAPRAKRSDSPRRKPRDNDASKERTVGRGRSKLPSPRRTMARQFTPELRDTAAKSAAWKKETTDLGWDSVLDRGFIAFHCDYLDNSVGKPEDNSFFDIPAIVEFMRRILTHPGNYFGIIDRSDVTLQFLCNDDKSVRVEIPDPARKGSKTTDMSLAKCVSLVKRAGPSLADLRIRGLVFESWG